MNARAYDPCSKRIMHFWRITNDHDARVNRLRDAGYKGQKVYQEIALSPFMKMLAKTAHAMAVAEYGLDAFRPLLTEVILRDGNLAPYYVGGATNRIPASVRMPTRASMGIRRISNKKYVVAFFRLYAYLGTPEYNVVVGEMRPNIVGQIYKAIFQPHEQNITWLDSVIAKYGDLDARKVLAVNGAMYSRLAVDRAAPYRIEVIKLEEKDPKDKNEFQSAEIRFLAFRDVRPCRISPIFKGVEQLRITYSTEGPIKTADESLQPCASFFLAEWRRCTKQVCTQKMVAFAMDNWETLTERSNVGNYLELDDPRPRPVTLPLDPPCNIEYDAINWGVVFTDTIEKIGGLENPRP